MMLLTGASNAYVAMKKRQGGKNTVFAMADGLSYATHVKSHTWHNAILSDVTVGSTP